MSAIVPDFRSTSASLADNLKSLLETARDSNLVAFVLLCFNGVGERDGSPSLPSGSNLGELLTLCRNNKAFEGSTGSNEASSRTRDRVSLELKSVGGCRWYAMPSPKKLMECTDLTYSNYIHFSTDGEIPESQSSARARSEIGRILLRQGDVGETDINTIATSLMSNEHTSNTTSIGPGDGVLQGAPFVTEEVNYILAKHAALALAELAHHCSGSSFNQAIDGLISRLTDTNQINYTPLTLRYACAYALHHCTLSDDQVNRLIQFGTKESKSQNGLSVAGAVAFALNGQVLRESTKSGA